MAGFTADTSRRVTVEGSESSVVDLAGPRLRAAVVPGAGGEVGSLQVRFGGEWVETLHRAMDYSDPGAAWRGRAPLQWPAVGRNCVPEELDADLTPADLMMGSWRCEGRRYPMPILGFAQYLRFEPVGAGADASGAWVEVRATACEYSRRFYPFAFEIVCRHHLAADVLRSRYTVRNLEPERRLPFSIGNHITFGLPFTAEGSFEECLLVSPTTEHVELTPQDLLSDRRLPKDLRSGARLSDPDLWNMAITGYAPGRAAVELHDPHAFGFRISQRELTTPPVMKPEDVFFILYAEPEHRCFCPEPWVGRPNSLNTGEGLTWLAPGAACIWEMTVEPQVG